MYAKLRVIEYSSFERNYVGSGIEGQYYRMSTRRGIKICSDLDFGSDKISMKDFKKSPTYREFSLLKKYHNMGLSTPEPYEIVLVRQEWVPGNPFYRLAIIMEHINGRMIGDIHRADGAEYLSLRSKLSKFKSKMFKYHKDLHESNIIYNRKRGFFAIDFGEYSR